MSYIKKYSFITSAFLLLSLNISGQPGQPPGGTGDGDPVEGGAGAPLDGGTIALLIAGSGLLYRKYFYKKENKS